MFWGAGMSISFENGTKYTVEFITILNTWFISSVLNINIGTKIKGKEEKDHQGYPLSHLELL